MRCFRLFLPALILAAVSLVGCSSPTASSSSAGAVVTTTTTPTVSAVVPAASAPSVAINSGLTATFSVAMDPLTITTANFTLFQGATQITGVVTNPTTTTANFAPTANLSAGLVYTATLSTAVKSAAGVALAASYIWTFTTSAAVAAPTVSSVTPVTGATGVALNPTLIASFSVLMDPTTITGSTFTLFQGATQIAGTVTNPSTTTANFVPTAALTASTTYTATLTTSVKSAASVALASAYIWTFTTKSASTALAAVNLDTATTQGTYGGAGQYVILAQTLVSASTGDAITGDVAVSPAAQSFLTGFGLTGVDTDVFRGSSLVTGKLFGADSGVPTPANLTQANTNMIAAYNDAAGRSNPDATELGAGDISGMTLAPGLYKWSTGVNINTALTLNGSATDVWIFQIAGTLALANGININLTGGALPQNIFWQSAGTAGVTIGTTAHFQGIVLASKQITVNTSAVVHGKLLSQTAVTLAATATVGP